MSGKQDIPTTPITETSPDTKGDAQIGEDYYEDIINLPHPVSKNHPQMSLRVRAAQFAPFAALTGHDEVIDETSERHIEEWNMTSGEGLRKEGFKE